MPLVTLLALTLGNCVFAQQIAHKGLYEYFAKIPQATAFPDSTTFASTDPEIFEKSADLDAIEKSMRSSDNDYSAVAIPVATSSDRSQRITGELPGITLRDEKKDVRTSMDVIQSALRDMQNIRTEFEGNFRRVEELYLRNVSGAYDASHRFFKDHPCRGGTDCQQEHLWFLNLRLVAASREKILNEEYLLSVYIAQVKPSFKAVEGALQTSGYGVNAVSRDAKNIFWGARENEVKVINDILERMKLERVMIANCGRLIRQSTKR